MTSEPVTVLGSELRMMDSRHTGKKYRITISLPLGYAAAPDEDWPFNDIPAFWPVIYIVDGNNYANMVTDMIRPMAWCGETTDAIVVGIGYPEDQNPIEAFREAFTRRNADLTPVRDEAEEKKMSEGFKRPAPTGDAGNFLKFIKNELIPVIEKDFRADPSKRILAGHSYGGLFAAFALFEAPALFDTLIIGSPTLTYGNRFTFQREEIFAQENKQLAAKVYLYVGEPEESLNDKTMTDTLRFAAILQGRKYEGLSVFKQVFPDQNHCAVAAPGIQWGIKSALKK